MRMLIIGPEEKKEIVKVIEFAKKNPISEEQLKSGSIIVGNIQGYVCKMTDGFRIVFSYEHQPIGWCKHISISIPSSEKVPSIPAVEMIIKEFGFTESINDQENVWMEEEVRAINVIEIEDDKDVIKTLTNNIKLGNEKCM